MPIHRAAFGGDGDSVVLAGRRPFFYVYHLGAGRAERVAPLAAAGEAEKSWETFCAQPAAAVAGGPPLLAFMQDGGRIPLVSLASRSVIHTLQMPGSARCGAFTADGRQLLSAGGDGTVYLWDLRMHRCLERTVDCGSAGLGVSSLAVSPTGGLWAAGGAAGVVNLYRRGGGEAGGGGGGGGGGGAGGAAPAAPSSALHTLKLKQLMNLTTSCDLLQFSPDGQMLAMGSRMRKDALRIVHLPSATVFSNWPSSKTPLHYVHCAAFSPHCGYLAAGNARGRVILYRLPFYDSL